MNSPRLATRRLEEERAKRFGFAWAQVLVARLAEVRRRATDKEPYRILQVNDLTIYVSPTGRTRVFRNHHEMKEIIDATPGQRDGAEHAPTGCSQPDQGG